MHLASPTGHTAFQSLRHLYPLAKILDHLRVETRGAGVEDCLSEHRFGLNLAYIQDVCKELSDTWEIRVVWPEAAMALISAKQKLRTRTEW